MHEKKCEYIQMISRFTYLFKKIFLSIPIAIENMISKQKFSSGVHLWKKIVL